MSGLKLGGAKFLQKAMHVESHLKNLAGKGQDNVHLNHMSNSMTTIPGYTNSTLNSKGFSYNPTPYERFDNSADQNLFNNGAQDSARYSKNNAKDTKDIISKTKKVFQEESKALGGIGPGQSFNGTVAGSYVEIKAPKWVCSVICAGLDVDEVLDDSRIKAADSNPSYLNKNFEPVSSSNQEEQDVLNVNQNQVNSVAYTEQS